MLYYLCSNTVPCTLIDRSNSTKCFINQINDGPLLTFHAVSGKSCKKGSISFSKGRISLAFLAQEERYPLCPSLINIFSITREDIHENVIEGRMDRRTVRIGIKNASEWDNPQNLRSKYNFGWPESMLTGSGASAARCWSKICSAFRRWLSISRIVTNFKIIDLYSWQDFEHEMFFLLYLCTFISTFKDLSSWQDFQNEVFSLLYLCRVYLYFYL